ncbi:protein virilizer homolog isoform X2 [Andrographis paniculata]|uniref:protein virilizer homolog isoform X2 n=1 Tax=Andrographis paniculata TaxID=175694 RepID=UPI0021E96CFA|nr:protein virilizer homolog isoform X2 [Andrographis paniculata]
MGARSEPCVLYAHTFVHPHLDEYVDEVLFAEPVVITACEFLEQNASSVCPAVKLMGATSPPSFALEVFIQCEGEARFRRFCLPCLYSHSSSNVLEVEAVVTNHLVVRGSYRSLSMVIYGNTAEDLGQFNIEVDLDSSMTDTVSAVEGNMDDLPPAFHPTTPTIKELVSPMTILSETVVFSDIQLELRKFLQLVFNVLESLKPGMATDKVINSLLSVASSVGKPSAFHKLIDSSELENNKLPSSGSAGQTLTEAKMELLDLYRSLHFRESSEEVSEESLPHECEVDIPSSKELMDYLHQHFDFLSNSGNTGYPNLSQKKNTILWLILARLLCSTRESCFHFVNYGGMKQLGYIFAHRNLNSTAFTLLLLGIIEQATQHSIGCEGFLGWWPRDDESIPSGTSDGYSQLLKLLLESQRHDVASLSTYLLHRLRFYEVSCRYEEAVLSVLGGISTDGLVTDLILDMLASAKMQLKKLLKLIKLSSPIDDPSPMAAASKSSILGDTGVLAYKATSGLIKLSNCGFLNWDIDSYLLSLLKERGFLPLSAALLSSSTLRSGTGHAMDLFVDVVSQIEVILLSLLFCRSGLNFLMQDPEVSSTIIHALWGREYIHKEDSLSLRHAYTLLSKGFFCYPNEVGMIIEMHMRALISVDRLCKLTPNTEEFLWVLWDLCRLSRSECGRQAVLVLVNFPEALKVLIAALHSEGECEPVSSNTGVSPLSLAIFHATAEIFEVIVMDSAATSLLSWIDSGKELHEALHSISPGSNKKDAPARLLEWIDAGLVYNKNGAIGLLRYAAVLASGEDVHMASNSVLASDMMDADNVLGGSNNSDGNAVDNLVGKHITEKEFSGVILRDSSIAQLTTAFRILAFISDNSVVAASLYDEGAVMVIHAIIINCRLMLERSSNTYDYLVDEGAEGNSTSDLLMERNREKSLFDLLIPSLILLINLLQKLQETKEQHRNSKLMDALLQLHREVSPKLAASVVELHCSCPDFVLGFGTVCHLLASALAYWPVYDWIPGLFHFLMDNLNATSLLALGPKEICSLFCLLNELFPGESIWLWKNGMPLQSPLTGMAAGILLGPEKEKQINWYLRPGNPEKLLAQLSPQLGKLGEIILHCALSMSVVIQDLLRVFVIRIACLNLDYASALIKPTMSWISDRLLEPSKLSDVDTFKVNQLLKFICVLMEHPSAKPLLLEEGGFQLFSKVLERCFGASNSGVKFPENMNLNYENSVVSWSIHIFRSISLISDCRAPVQQSAVHERDTQCSFTSEEFFILWSYLLKACMVLPVGTELHACLSAFKEMGSSAEGQRSLLAVVKHLQCSENKDSESKTQPESDQSCSIIYALSDWKECPPLLSCLITLLRSINSKEVPPVQVMDAVGALVTGALGFCLDDESVSLERVVAIKLLFGIENDSEDLVQENLKHVENLTRFFGFDTNNEASDSHPTQHQIKEVSRLLLLLLQKPMNPEEYSAIASSYASLVSPISSRIYKFGDRKMDHIEDSTSDDIGAMFSWECPENLRNRLAQTGLSAKRKTSSLEGPNRHARGDALAAEATSQSTFSRGSAPVSTPTGPTRRDAFRLRKPNTSRPPSMHVDDYVARERNADGTNTSSVIAVSRMGSSSGRPPSVHVDVFMARQRERQNIVGAAVNDLSNQVKTTAAEDSIDTEKLSKPRQVKPDLDDDLQGIDIVFDAEEAEPDDKLPFPQPDDNLPQPPSAVAETLSPHSIAEENESDFNGSSQGSRLGTPLASNMDENTPSEYSSRISASRPEMPLTREPSITSDKKFPDQLENLKTLPNRPNAIDPSSVSCSSGVASSVYVNNSSSARFAVDARAPPNMYYKSTQQQSGSVPLSTAFPGFFEKNFPSNQPPLPPMPPPPTVSPLTSQNIDPAASSSFGKSAVDVQAQVPPYFHVHPGYASSGANSSGPVVSSPSLTDMKFGRSAVSGAMRPLPPLPPTPPPYSANTSLKNSASQYFPAVSSSELQQASAVMSTDGAVNLSASRTMLTSYPPPPPLMQQPMVYRPGSIPVSHGNNSTPNHGDSLSNVSQNLPFSIMPSAQPMPTLTPLQPLQPPQIPRPPPQHLRPPVPAAAQSEMQGTLQIPAQSSQALQQPQVSNVPSYYQTQQQENASHLLLQQVDRSQRIMQMPGPADAASQQQDLGMSLQEYFRSPEAIQSLLSDRDKLCQLLEQNPKLMQMLQDRLGQL